MLKDPIPDIDHTKLEEFAKICQEIRKHTILDTNILTATNYKQEEKKFFQSTTYNPQFTYNIQNPREEKNIEKAQKYLETIDLPEDFRLYLTHYLKGLNDMNNTVKSVGTENFATYAAEVFNLNTPKIQKYLNMSPEITLSEERKTKLYNAEEIAQVFRQKLKEYGITHYKVEVDNFNDHTVRVGHNKIVLGSKIKRYQKNVERLIHHEIDSHVIQRINGDENNILSLTLPSDRILYSEGLAVYNEVQTQKITPNIYQIYALRLQAVRSLNLSFREIYTELSSAITPPLAYKITYRVKRGTRNTSLPGGFPKDAFYLLGYLAVKDYVSTGNNLQNLYYARTPDMYYFATKYNLLTDKDIILPAFLRD